MKITVQTVTSFEVIVDIELPNDLSLEANDRGSATYTFEYFVPAKGTFSVDADSIFEAIRLVTDNAEMNGTEYYVLLPAN
jgi:hypothetical protein